MPYLPLHYAARFKAPVEVVRALLDAYPQGAETMNNEGRLPLHLAAEADDDFYCPKVHVVLALAHAGYPPSRPWTPRAHIILRGLAAVILKHEARVLIDAHLSRVRTLLLALPRLLHGSNPSALAPLLINPVYASDFLS